MTASDWLKVQQRLMKLGFNPGPLDGIRGRMTIAAVKRFQESIGLVVDGIVGPNTWSAMFGPPAAGTQPHFDEMPWYEEALRLIGTREIVGPGSTQTILDFAETIDIDYDDDDIPWCGLFVGHCIGATLPDENLPNNPLGARNWNRFGMECEPQLGSVLVFWRGSRDGWMGHVGFYHREDSSAYHVLGGNQSNSVNVARLGKDRLLGARWPITAGSPPGKIVQGAGVGSLSRNEA